MKALTLALIGLMLLVAPAASAQEDILTGCPDGMIYPTQEQIDFSCQLDAALTRYELGTETLKIVQKLQQQLLDEMGTGPEVRPATETELELWLEIEKWAVTDAFQSIGFNRDSGLVQMAGIWEDGTTVLVAKDCWWLVENLTLEDLGMTRACPVIWAYVDHEVDGMPATTQFGMLGLVNDVSTGTSQ